MSDRTRRYREAGSGLFSTPRDVLQSGLMLANDGKRNLSRVARDELRTKLTGTTNVNDRLGDHLRNSLFAQVRAHGTDLSVHPKTGIVAVFRVQDQRRLNKLVT